MRPSVLHQSRSGHLLSDSTWLDSHYEACKAEYESLLDYVPIEQGMTLLDAGCGSGSFLPALRERVGDTGAVFALDFDDANVRASEGYHGRMLTAGAVGSVLSLPYRDRSFDAVWCANTAQYFEGTDLDQLLWELRRVVRSGGSVAVKDVDMTGFRIEPAPPLLGAHLAEAAISGLDVTPQSIGSLRGRNLRRCLEEAGIDDVRQASVLIERWGPLGGADKAFWQEWLPYLAEVALSRGVPDEDARVWSQLATPELAGEFVTRDDFYGCELQVVAYGTVQ
jgi:ubiquinone/menaquinone biosynthesis C-methylase UbiE